LNLIDNFRKESTKINISYEPSYRAFDVDGSERTDQVINSGRKIFGSFIPDIDVYTHLPVGCNDLTGTH
jgi:hypothetical protein